MLRPLPTTIAPPRRPAPTHATARRRQANRRRFRGQSLVEFALVLPVMLIVIMFGVDFGRAFLGWVNLQNASRLGANYASLHPDANWGSAGAVSITFAEPLDGTFSFPVSFAVAHAHAVLRAEPDQPLYEPGRRRMACSRFPDRRYRHAPAE